MFSTRGMDLSEPTLDTVTVAVHGSAEVDWDSVVHASSGANLEFSPDE